MRCVALFKGGSKQWAQRGSQAQILLQLLLLGSSLPPPPQNPARVPSGRGPNMAQRSPSGALPSERSPSMPRTRHQYSPSVYDLLFLGRGPREENPSIPGNKFSLPGECKSLRSHLFLRRVNKSDTAVNAKRSQSPGLSPVLHALRAVLPHWESHTPLGQSWAGFGGSSAAAAQPCWWPRGSVSPPWQWHVSSPAAGGGAVGLIQLLQIILQSSSCRE